ncbi:uncharacterized protein LOC111262352 isoform X2 [Varroa jacobsoni]|nr:uncharacterized protein LOC111245350 isoform X3 [Varroa destructor]XP_022649331.1 uncharacterized protein LOC111245350 isoform X3 [Varroa destructor]XP_022692282.1 uncharacterized protein LOC111262352 isoform X2 [Varroa jacobsoni]XP_022692283.1 uncharacterized protein LOC111262352 isoform X2 [Varroa jacobsoni]
MREKCHSCGENAVIYNEEQRCEICCYCGVVGEVSLVSGSAAALDTDMRTFCNENTVTKFRMGRRGIRQGVCTTSNSLSSMGKTGLIGREQLLHMLSTFEVPMAASEEALTLYGECCRKRFPQREAKALAGGVLMYILRREKRSLTFREIADACGSTVKEVGKQFKIVSEKIIQRGGDVPVQPSLGDTIQQSIEVFTNKFSGQSLRNEYRIPEVISKALELSDWIDRCTMMQRCPPHLFALSVFFLAFKAVNVERFFRMTLADFNTTHGFYPMSNLKIPSFYKISPNAIIQTVCEVVNTRGGYSMLITQASFFFLLDLVLKLKAFFAYKVTDRMTSVEGDVAFENFKEVKEAQEMLESSLQEDEHDDGSLSMVIPESELSQYILTQKEQSLKQEVILREQLRRCKEGSKQKADNGKQDEQLMTVIEKKPVAEEAELSVVKELAQLRTEQTPMSTKSTKAMKRSRPDDSHSCKIELKQNQLPLDQRRRLVCDELDEEERDPQDATTMLALFRSEEFGDINDE